MRHIENISCIATVGRLDLWRLLARSLNLWGWIDEVGFEFAGIDGRGGAGRGISGEGGSYGLDQRRRVDLWRLRGV